MKLITVRVVDIYNGMPQRATLSMLQFTCEKKNLLRATGEKSGQWKKLDSPLFYLVNWTFT